MPKKTTTPKKPAVPIASPIVALAEIATERDARNDQALRDHPGARQDTEEYRELAATLDAGIEADRRRMLESTPRTLADAAVQMLLLHHHAWLTEGEEYDDDPARPSLVLARALRIVAEHAGLDLRLVGGERLIDYEGDACDVFPEFAAAE
jgi:hypothetical protein